METSCEDAIFLKIPSLLGVLLAFENDADRIGSFLGGTLRSRTIEMTQPFRTTGDGGSGAMRPGRRRTEAEIRREVRKIIRLESSQLTAVSSECPAAMQILDGLQIVPVLDGHARVFPLGTRSHGHLHLTRHGPLSFLRGSLLAALATEQRAVHAQRGKRTIVEMPQFRFHVLIVLLVVVAAQLVLVVPQVLRDLAT